MATIAKMEPMSVDIIEAIARRKLMKFSFLIAAMCLASSPCFAWDGEDSNTGEAVTIESGNLVRSGEDIELYDESDGTYHSVEVQSIEDTGTSTDIEVYDYDDREYRTLEMEQD